MYWLAGISGLAIILSPFLLNYEENLLVLLTSIFVGIVLLSIAGARVFYGGDDVTKIRHIR